MKHFRSLALVACTLFSCVQSLSSPATAAVLFSNPNDPSAEQTFWCDPCATGNVGYRVWDSFTLTDTSQLNQFNWLGLRTDALTQGVNFEISNAPYAPSPLFSQHFPDGTIIRSDTGVRSSVRTIFLPDIVLTAGTYWLTVYGPSILETHTWLGLVQAIGDNSLIQYGPDPENPIQTLYRNQDARFAVFGEVNPVPLPAALPLFATALIGGGVIAWRKKRKQKAEAVAA